MRVASFSGMRKCVTACEPGIFVIRRSALRLWHTYEYNYTILELVS